MDRVAIVRFILAVLYWLRAESLGSYPDGLTDKLFIDSSLAIGKHAPCFNLLGAGHRFYQDRTASRLRTATDLLHEIPTGNNFQHFRHSIDKSNGLCFACCAMGLLRLPLFSVSGLPDLKAGINGAPPIYVMFWGRSLAETLGANWNPSSKLGVPAWVNPTIRALPGEEVPSLVGLTLLSRRVWLHEDFSEGTCIACGSEVVRLVKTCEFQSAGEQRNELWNDPNVVYSLDVPRKVTKAPDLTATRKFKTDRPWPELFARMIEAGRFNSTAYSTKLLVVAFATDQARYVDVWERLVDIPPTLSGETPASFVRQWQKETSALYRRAHPRLEKGTSRKFVEISAITDSIRPHVEGKVLGNIENLLTGDTSAWQRAADEYRPMMQMVANSLSPGITTSALLRRNQIASAIPNMRPKTESTKKISRRKGGHA